MRARPGSVCCPLSSRRPWCWCSSNRTSRPGPRSAPLSPRKTLTTWYSALCSCKLDQKHIISIKFHCHLCRLIACGNPKPIGLPVGSPMTFWINIFWENASFLFATVTMVLLPPFTRDPMVFVIPRINFHHSWDYKTTSLNWISLVMKVDTRDYKNHWIPRRVVIISQCWNGGEFSFTFSKWL